ncbi:MAG: glycosyltransferase, partial [Burkholderiales bacterium]
HQRRHALNYKVVFQNVGIPTRRYFRAVPLDRWFMKTVLRQADQCLVLSAFAQQTLAREFGVAARVLPPPVSVGDFRAAAAQALAPSPTLLFVGDLDEPRKGARVLCQAFVRLKRHRPDLKLRFVGRASPPTRQALAELPGVSGVNNAIEFEGVGQVASLPAQFNAASVTVLPSVWEAFGLVLVESLAAGTPVVGARHGGVTDIIQGELVGELFDPGNFEQQSLAAESLASAIETVLARGKTPEVIAACQARAASFGWDVQGPAYIDLIEALGRGGLGQGPI